MDAALLQGGLDPLFARIGMPPPRRLAVVIVNAAAHRGAEWTQREVVPGILHSISQLGDAIGEEVNGHSLNLFRQMLDRWRTRTRASVGEAGPAPDCYLITVSFDQLADAEERRFCQNLPTNFSLPPATIDRLAAVGRKLLRESPEFQRLRRDLGPRPGE